MHRPHVLGMLLPALLLLVPIEAAADGGGADKNSRQHAESSVTAERQTEGGGEREIGHHLGVLVSPHEPDSWNGDQIGQLQRAGITFVELEAGADQPLHQILAESEFHFFIRNPRRFDTGYRIGRSDSLYLSEDLAVVEQFREVLTGRLAAYAPFSYPDDFTTGGRRAIGHYLQILNESIHPPIPFYYLSARSSQADASVEPAWLLRSMRIKENDGHTCRSGMHHFTPGSDSPASLTRLIELLDCTLGQQESLVVIPYGWLTRMLDRYEWLEDLLETYRRDQRLLSLQPEPETPPLPLNVEVILTVLLLGSYLLHFRRHPFYRSASIGYFLSRKMFVEQILEYRQRTFLPGLILFVQHVFLVTIAFYTVSESLVGPLGLQALIDHFPLLSPLGAGPVSFLAATAGCALLIQSVSVIWLRLPGFSCRIGQSLALYSWPLQLNLLLTLGMVALLQTEGSGIRIGLLGLLFSLIWFLGFHIAAADIARSLDRYRFLYLSLTSVLHVIVILFMLFLLLFHPPLAEGIRLAFKLD